MLNPFKNVLIVSGLGIGSLSVGGGRGEEDRQSLGAGNIPKKNHFI